MRAARRAELVARYRRRFEMDITQYRNHRLGYVDYLKGVPIRQSYTLPLRYRS